VGGACGKNPISIIIPCHRVLAANFKIGGFSGNGGTHTKVSLLRVEGITLKNLKI
jgi:methylated-DNA-[protein]-cysteine S-methyltransferase